MRLQFTLRSLLGVVLFWAVLLSLLCLPVPMMSFLGGVTFWLVLLVPFWIPQFFMTAEARKHEKVHPWLALIPAAWYCILIFLFHLARTHHIHLLLSKIGAVGGTVVACSVLLLLTRRGWWYMLVAPLGFATISGTVWFVMTGK